MCIALEVCVTVCVCVCVCLSVCLSVIISLCSWVIFVYVDAVYWFYECSFLCLIGCFSMIVRTPTVFECLIYMYAFSIFVFAPVQHN